MYKKRENGNLVSSVRQPVAGQPALAVSRADIQRPALFALHLHVRQKVLSPVQFCIQFIHRSHEDTHAAVLDRHLIDTLHVDAGNIREWNDRYREISQAVATAKAVLDIAASYEQTYADFAYFVSGFKELDMDYYEVQSYVNEAWYYLLLVSGEIRRCREYFKPGMSMTDWERLDRVERTERRMKLIQSALSAYIADTFGLIDYARAAEYNMAELQDAFSVPYD